MFQYPKISFDDFPNLFLERLLKPTVNPEYPYPGVSTKGYGLWECQLYYAKPCNPANRLSSDLTVRSGVKHKYCHSICRCPELNRNLQTKLDLHNLREVPTVRVLKREGLEYILHFDLNS